MLHVSKPKLSSSKMSKSHKLKVLQLCHFLPGQGLEDKWFLLGTWSQAEEEHPGDAKVHHSKASGRRRLVTSCPSISHNREQVGWKDFRLSGDR